MKEIEVEVTFDNTKEEVILSWLNQNLYQTELGIGGRNISELKKELASSL